MNNKYTYLFWLVEAINCNPNGDPNDTNFPRVTPFNWDVKLEISPYAIKRKMRNAWSDLWLNVILDEKSRSKTIKQAYWEAFKTFGAKISTKWDEVDLSWLTNAVIDEYIDIVFWIYRDMKVKWIDDDLFKLIKKQQLVISETKSLNTVWHKLDSFRKTLTTHFVSDTSKNDQAWGMWSYNIVDYALFPIVMSSQVEYKSNDNILKWFVNGFNHNMTATKNFNVFSSLILNSDIPLKKSFITTENASIDGNNLILNVSEKAKGIIVSWKEYIEWKWYNDFTDKDLYEILTNYTTLYNNNNK